MIAEPKITGSGSQECMGPEMLCRQTFHVVNMQGSQLDRVQGLLSWRHAMHSLLLNSTAKRLGLNREGHKQGTVVNMQGVANVDKLPFIRC
jgi:hypothetical protein